MAGIAIRDRDGRAKRLVSTKGYSQDELETFQLMVEDLLHRAHASGRNVVHRTDGLFVGAVWTDQEAEKKALAGSKTALGLPTGRTASVVPPAERGETYVPRGASLSNPVLGHGAARFLTEAHELRRARGTGRGMDRVTFYSEDERYPCLVIGIEED